MDGVGIVWGFRGLDFFLFENYSCTKFLSWVSELWSVGIKGKGTSEKMYPNMPLGEGNKQQRALKIAFEAYFMLNSSSVRQAILKDLEKRIWPGRSS